MRRPHLQITATDRMPQALAWAQRNAERLRVGGRVELLHGHWLDAVPARRFDVIVSNPPYIAAADPHLGLGDLRFEPVTALAGGADGLADLRTIAAGAPRHLCTGGTLLLEHGYDQGAAVRHLLQAAGFAGVTTHLDLAGHERVTLGVLR